MDPVRPRIDPTFTAQTAALAVAWEENLARAEPVRQRIYSDYQRLIEAREQLDQWLRSGALESAQRSALRSLEERVSACLAFASIRPEKVATIRKLLSSDRSRGCHSSLSALERELLESLTERALED
jgi:hypothetical protein